MDGHQSLEGDEASLPNMEYMIPTERSAAGGMLEWKEAFSANSPIFKRTHTHNYLQFYGVRDRKKR